MAITEADRLKMHLGLQAVLGDEVGDIVMEHLPPSGWGDVARKNDLLILRDEMNYRFQHVDARFDDVHRRVDGLVHAMWAMTGIFSTAFIALFTLLATRG